jgi:hypothetical protein
VEHGPRTARRSARANDTATPNTSTDHAIRHRPNPGRRAGALRQSSGLRGHTMYVITISIPDPAALGWGERYSIRKQAADEHRAETGTDEPVAVDIMAEGQG